MGLQEERDRDRVLQGKKLRVGPKLTLKGLLLYPYFAWKNYQHRREVRKSLLKNMFEDQGE